MPGWHACQLRGGEKLSGEGRDDVAARARIATGILCCSRAMYLSCSWRSRRSQNRGKVKRTSLVGEEPRPATFGQHLSATRCGMQPDPRALCYQVSCGGHRRHDGFNSKQNLGFTHQPAPTHLQHPYEKRPKVSKKMLAERCSTQSSTGREWIPKGAGNGDPWRR